jgi:hypothetical protein
MLTRQRRGGGKEPSLELAIGKHNGDPLVWAGRASSCKQVRAKLCRAVVVSIEQDKHASDARYPFCFTQDSALHAAVARDLPAWDQSRLRCLEPDYSKFGSYTMQHLGKRKNFTLALDDRSDGRRCQAGVTSPDCRALRALATTGYAA